MRIAFDLDAKSELHEKLPEGIRLPGCFDAFEMSTRAILGQQIMVKAARTLTRRLVELLGKAAKTPWDEINYYFPTAKDICEIKKPIDGVLGPLGIIKNRSFSILTLAKAISSGEVNLVLGGDADLQRENLLSLKGIGPWTAEYLIMRGMSWPDAFPVSDIGVKHGLHSKLVDEEYNLLLDNVNELSKYQLNKKYEHYANKYAEDYKPWRSYLTIALWYGLSVD